MAKKKKIYKKGLAHLRNELDKKFDIERATGDEFYIEIKSEYIRFIQYFLEKEQDNLTVISKLGKSNEEKLKATVDRNTIKRFILADPNAPHKPQGKPCDYLCVSLGYFGWISFQQGKNKIDLSEIITSDSNIGVKEDLKTGLKEEIRIPHPTAANIPGVMVIDENFRKKIHEGKAFSRAEFYTAKQNDHCQWFGILHHYDIERKVYPEIKKSLENSFKKELTYKVSAVVCGDGGSGKSTLLRKLALDWCREAPFSVVWLMPESLEDFVKDGLEIIKENTSKNYMLIIEDWQALQPDEKNAKILLEKSNRIDNVRLCIGSRNTNNNALYHHYMYDQDHTVFALKPDENKEIITRIIRKFPEWKEAADSILKYPENDSVPLFLLLFLLASYKAKDGSIRIDLTEPLTAFRSIIQNDFERIYKKNEGMAKAVYYYACFYSGTKAPFLYESFLLLTEKFNGNEDPGLVMDILQVDQYGIANDLIKYFNLQKLSPLNVHVMHFNHDLFAESGFIKMYREDWEGYEEWSNYFMAQINLSVIKGKMTLILLNDQKKSEDD